MHSSLGGVPANSAARNNPCNLKEKPSSYIPASQDGRSRLQGDHAMLDMLRIVIAGTLLYGTTAFNSPVEAAKLNRVLPPAMHPVKVEPCQASWPYLIRTCVA